MTEPVPISHGAVTASVGADPPAAVEWPANPVVYEVNTAVWLAEVVGPTREPT